MKRKKVLLSVIIGVMIISLMACKEQKKIIDVKLTDLIESEDITTEVLQLCFQSLPGGNEEIKRQAYLVKNNRIYAENDTYTMGCFQNYSDKRILELSEKLGYSDINVLHNSLGQVYIYRNYEEYELYVFEGERLANKKQFNIVFHKENDIKLIEIPHNENERIDSVYKDNQMLYLFYKNAFNNNISLYKIDTNTYEYTSDELKIEEIDVQIDFDNIIEKNNNIYLIYTGNAFIEYDLKKDDYSVRNIDGMKKVIFLLNGNENIYLIGYDDDGRACFYEYVLSNGEIKKMEVELPEEIKDYNISSLRHFYFYENKIYGMLSGQNRKKYALLVYDVKKSKIIRAAKIETDNNGFGLVDNTWLYTKGDRMVYMK